MRASEMEAYIWLIHVWLDKRVRFRMNCDLLPAGSKSREEREGE